ncbi:hypothetical protein Moror_5102 [Moniliophthora roreri MCA 2997]|uniref:Uncharacterized protein n=1 Tax=Moniliophthora roreri (strain MCA 2997) TaxID=1381753 RepID=V2WIY6_MONRO|nr:hypothetical protein Moror_5102 [Moniliophthora roreri MCA 2997]
MVPYYMLQGDGEAQSLMMGSQMQMLSFSQMQDQKTKDLSKAFQVLNMPGSHHHTMRPDKEVVERFGMDPWVNAHGPQDDWEDENGDNEDHTMNEEEKYNRDMQEYNREIADLLQKACQDASTVHYINYQTRQNKIKYDLHAWEEQYDEMALGYMDWSFRLASEEGYSLMVSEEGLDRVWQLQVFSQL